MSTTLEGKFKELRKTSEKALIGFVTAYYPAAEDTSQIALAMVNGGVQQKERKLKRKSEIGQIDLRCILYKLFSPILIFSRSVV